MGLDLGRLAVSAVVGCLAAVKFFNCGESKGISGGAVADMLYVPVGLAAGSATFIGLSMLMAPAEALEFCGIAATALASGFACKFISSKICNSMSVSEKKATKCAEVAFVAGAFVAGALGVALPYLTGAGVSEGVAMAAK